MRRRVSCFGSCQFYYFGSIKKNLIQRQALRRPFGILSRGCHAQHALREGKLVAENVVAAMNGNPLKEFRFRALGILVGLGHRTGAAEIRGWRFSGLLAWFMWRSIYLSKLPGLEKKVRVFLDWFIDLFFPRDTVLTSSAESLMIGDHSLSSNDRDDAAHDSESPTGTGNPE